MSQGDGDFDSSPRTRRCSVKWSRTVSASGHFCHPEGAARRSCTPAPLLEPPKVHRKHLRGAPKMSREIRPRGSGDPSPWLIFLSQGTPAQTSVSQGDGDFDSSSEPVAEAAPRIRHRGAVQNEPGDPSPWLILVSRRDGDFDSSSGHVAAQ